MADYKITPSVDYTKWLKLLNIKLTELTNPNKIKVPKVVKPKNKKTFI